MRWEVFKHTLRRGLRPALIWGVVTAIFANYVILLTPDMEGLLGFMALFEAMPGIVLQAFGITDISVMATPEGFVGFAFFTYASILLAIYAVNAGMSITANDEEKGIMNMVLSLPVSRGVVVVEKVLAQAILSALVCAIGFAGFFAGTRINPVVSSFDLGRSAEAFAALWALIVAVMGITVLSGVVIRRRGIAEAVAAGYLGVSYVAYTLGAMAGEQLGPVLERISVFSYYDGGDIILNGLNIMSPLVMIALGAALVWLSVRLYERRDISG